MITRGTQKHRPVVDALLALDENQTFAMQVDQTTMAVCIASTWRVSHKSCGIQFDGSVHEAHLQGGR